MDRFPERPHSNRGNPFSLRPLHLVPLILLLLSTVVLYFGLRQSLISHPLEPVNLIVPGSTGIGNPPRAIELQYNLPERATVTALLEGPVSSTLMTTEQAPGLHTFRFNAVLMDNTPHEGYSSVRRVVPDGFYIIRISANSRQLTDANVAVQNADTTPPTLQNIVIKPEVVSPNSDAVDDVAEVTFRTEQTATLSIDLTDNKGQVTPMLAPVEKGPGEQNAVITAQDLIGQPLPNGVYTATIRAEDRAGNRVEAYRPVKVEGAGEASIEILKVEITPQQIIAGQAISVSITVRNNGDVPLRTQGPDAGFTYTTNDTYASIEGNRYTDKAGLWRIGVDWDANGGGGAYRYPFRWGFGKTLMPGETVITGGKIVILKQEREMWFYAGVLQEGIRIALDRLGRTRVGVDF